MTSHWSKPAQCAGTWAQRASLSAQRAGLNIALAAGLLALAMLPSARAADTVKIGFISTLSGPGGALGIDIRDGFNLAIKNGGGKLGGLTVDLMTLDDQQKPDVGVQAAQRALQQHKADIITGVVFSNILLPILPPILDSKTFYISPNTGPADYAGAKCSRRRARCADPCRAAIDTPPGRAGAIPRSPRRRVPRACARRSARTTRRDRSSP